MKIDNYAFVRVRWSDNNVTMLTTEKDNSENPEDSRYYVALLGKSYGREGFEDGQPLHTSAIKEYSEDGNKVVTYSGSVYELGEKNPGYVAYEKAVEKGIPIIREWAIGVIEETEALYLQGDWDNPEDDFFRKQIVAQEGPILTTVDGNKVFVDWISINLIQLRHLRSENRRGQLKGDKFYGMAFEPDIFANDWKSSRAGGAGMLSVEYAKDKGII